MAEAVAGYGVPPRELLLESAVPGEFDAVRHIPVTEGFFDVLGERPILGQLPPPEHYATQVGPSVLVISHRHWLRRFGGDPDVIGRTIAWPDQQRSTIIAVMPPRFEYPLGAEVWFPAYVPKSWIADQNSRNVRIAAKVGAGTSPQTLEQELAHLQSLAVEEFPGTDAGWTPVVTTLRDDLVGRMRPALVALHLLVGLLAILSCVNILTLMPVRAQSRRTQYAIQLAFGAPVSALRWQLVLEGLMVAAIGWIVAALTAHAMLGPAELLLQSWLPQLGAFEMSGRVRGWSLALSLCAGASCGILTSGAIECAPSATTLLSASHRIGDVRVQRRWREGAVMCQIALAVVIVSGGGIAATEVRRLYAADPGFSGSRICFRARTQAS